MAEDNIYKGNLYFKYFEQKNGVEKESCDEAKKRLNSQLLEFKRKGYLKADDVPDEELLSFIEEIFFNGKSFTLFVKNATVGISSQCRIMEYTPQSCPFSNQSECVLNEMQNSYMTFYIRPSADRPVFDEIFPTDEILSFKCRRAFCPHSANGSILQISKFAFVKKSERQEDEIAVQGSMFFKDKWSNNADKPDNILKADLLRIMPSISEKSKEALQEWENYLEWRNRLVQLKNNGIRYIAKETDLEENTVTFTVIAETEEKFKRNQFWRREKIIIVRDISYSTDQWKYNHKEWEKASEKRALRIYLGEFISSEKISDETGTYTDNYRRFIPDSCPWKRPFIARLKFSLQTELKEKNSTKKPPENGFITFISGDVYLINRMKETISNFKEGKVAAAPRLSSYMFDIKKAASAEKENLELVFFSKNLKHIYFDRETPHYVYLGSTG